VQYPTQITRCKNQRKKIKEHSEKLFIAASPALVKS
jgi:hypothetical protein